MRVESAAMSRMSDAFAHSRAGVRRRCSRVAGCGGWRPAAPQATASQRAANPAYLAAVTRAAVHDRPGARLQVRTSPSTSKLAGKSFEDRAAAARSANAARRARLRMQVAGKTIDRDDRQALPLHEACRAAATRAVTHGQAVGARGPEHVQRSLRRQRIGRRRLDRTRRESAQLPQRGRHRDARRRASRCAASLHALPRR